MIPPIDKDLLDDDDSHDHLRSRPEWLKFYYARWSDSTKLMDAEQKGWYLNLLMHAASQGDPPGYLIDDDEELRYIAGVKDLDAVVKQTLCATEAGAELISQMAVKQGKRWLRVRNKFKPSTGQLGLIYNKMLVSTLKEAYRKRKFAIQAAKTMHAKRTALKEIDADAEQQHSDRKADAEQTLCDSSEILEIEKEIEIREKNITKKQKAKSVFEESKFEVTTAMAEHIKVRYPTFEQKDIDYMKEKFCEVFYGRSAISWSRTFYVFIKNTIQYGYKLQGAQSDGRAIQKDRFESTTDRNTRLEQEADERIRQLRSGSGRTDKIDPPGLSLGEDDYS